MIFREVSGTFFEAERKQKWSGRISRRRYSQSTSSKAAYSRGSSSSSTHDLMALANKSTLPSCKTQAWRAPATPTLPLIFHIPSRLSTSSILILYLILSLVDPNDQDSRSNVHAQILSCSPVAVKPLQIPRTGMTSERLLHILNQALIHFNI